MKKTVSCTLLLSLSLPTPFAAACWEHAFFQSRISGGSANRLAALATPEPSIKITHAPMTKAAQGVASEIPLTYIRPRSSSDVRILLSSSGGVRLVDDEFGLRDYQGNLTIGFTLEKPGYNTIKVKVVGLDKGQEVSYSSVIYIQAKR